MTFVTTYKQADLTLTGTMRKAQLAATATKTSRKLVPSLHTASPPPNLPDLQKRRTSEISSTSAFYPSSEEKIKQCEKCRVRFSPVWWSLKGDDGRVLCHKCQWGLIHNAGQMTGPDGRASPVVNGIPVGLLA